MDRPFLQTPEWLAFQKSLGRKVWRLDDGFLKANIIRHDVRLGQNFLYIPYGPELNLELAKGGLRNEVQHFATYVRDLAREQGSMFVKLEPTHDAVVELLIRNGLRLRRSPVHLQPMYTVVADLTKTEEQLLDAMHHKTRYNVKLAEKKGVTVAMSDDVDAFVRLLAETAKRDRFRPHPPQHYRKLLNAFSAPGALHTQLWFAYVGGSPVAGALMLEHGHTVHYLHGASDRAQRALMAPHLLHWTMLREYKRRGFASYDFWGIDAKRWPGVTRFKLGWGAKLVEYAGSFDLVTKRFWRWAYLHLPR